MRPIDADEVKRDIAIYHAGLKPRYISKLVDAEISDIQDIIDESPTVEAEPVRHGEWLLRRIYAGHAWECSVCHQNPCIYVTNDTKYCPNCGAKMDGGAEDDA